MPEFQIHATPVALPVDVRVAAAGSASFVVPARAVRSVIDYSGLEVFEPFPGKALCAFAFVDYVDGDLGPYHEFAVTFMVKPPGEGAKRRLPGVFVHWLPVDGEFTLAAGRTIWGFPKQLTEIDVSFGGKGRGRCVVRDGSTPVVDLTIGSGLPAPTPGKGFSFDAYTCLDGTLRRTPWTMAPAGVRARPSGTELVLGDHPVAEELARLGLPKRDVFSSGIANLRMSFGEAEELGR